MDRFSYSVFQFCQSRRLLETGDKIIISISGGPDSVALFRVLHNFRDQLNLSLHLLHFHHGLRTESDQEEAFIRELANRFQTPLTVKRADHLKGVKGMQNLARDWRYENLKQLTVQLGFNKIALGHHLDDLMETQLWKMIRGGSLFTLNPMQAIEMPYIRPFLETPKQDLKAYLNRLKQPWCEDASNQSCDYTRNLIRNRIVPLLEKCAGGRLTDKFLHLNHDAEALRDLFNEQIPAEYYQNTVIDYQMIQPLNKVLAAELLHRFLLFHGQEEISRKNIEKILELVRKNQGNWKVVLKNGWYVKGFRKQISIEQGAVYHRPL